MSMLRVEVLLSVIDSEYLEITTSLVPIRGLISLSCGFDNFFLTKNLFFMTTTLLIVKYKYGWK